ncbi:MAG TPA: cyclic nucleotide-binding domain-containing protein [Myxococcaceae bacterium]|nr:cyclic nucleotide-binding domain-containing protein [Myxococcaceae bacterium]
MRILIAGGGRVGGVLAAKLIAEQHQVTVVERDRAVCDRLFEEVGALVVCGDAMNPQVLESAGIVGTDVACAVLPRDSDNLAFAMLVRTVGGARTMVRMLDPSYRQAYVLAGVRDIIAEAEVVVAKMTTAIDFPQIAGSLPLAAGDAVLFEVVIKPRAVVAGRSVAQVRADPDFPKECVFIGFLDAEGKIALPDGATTLRPGHTAILVTRRGGLGQAVDVLTREPVVQDPAAQLVDALRRVDFLAPLDDAEIERIAQGIVVRTERAGEVLFRRGDPGETFYIVLSGEVTLETEDGKALEHVNPGGFFGEIALLTGQPRSTQAIVRQDAQLAEIGRDEFQEVVMANPTVAVGMSRILGQRLANTSRAPAPKKRGLFRR